MIKHGFYIFDEIRESLIKDFADQCIFDEPLIPYTSLGIGGKADILFTPKDKNNLSKFFKFIKNNKIPYFIIGGGTNLLISDEGFKGAIIRMTKLNKIELEASKNIYCDAGVDLRKLVNFCSQEGYSGLEFASGIPGTVGGALKCNAGGKHGNFEDVVKYIEGLNKDSQNIRYSKTELNFSYRNCIPPENLIITGAKLEVSKSNSSNVKNKVKAILKEKAENQPLNKKSAGCIFKNLNNISTGKLIDELNLKGLSIGDAIISTKHANFIINKGKAKAEDVKNLISIISKKAKKNEGIKLELEIQKVGF